MTTQLPSAGSPAIGPMSREMDGQAPGVRGLGRLIPVALALYLTPVLLIVLVVGGSGMIVLAAARLFAAVVKGPGPWPRTSEQTRSPLV
jgi:hypothetical protein